MRRTAERRTAGNRTRTGVAPLPEIAPGRVARVVAIDASAGDWSERLQAYGLAPGLELTVLQHRPVTVVRVERTELAFERRIAAAILVSTGAPSVPGAPAAPEAPAAPGAPAVPGAPAAPEAPVSRAI